MTSGIVVVGAGGHAKVCIELLQAAGEAISFCVAGQGGPASCLGIPVLCGDENLSRLRAEGFDRAFVALGSNALRGRIGSELLAMGYTLVNAISPAAVVSPSARLGCGIAIMAGAVLNADVVLHDFVIINTGATVDHDCVVGAAVHVAPQSGLAGNVHVGKFSFIGIGTSVIPETRIGEHATVGAGSAVVKDVPAGATVVGVPARVIKTKAI
jgi:UDP-perosamine 4-acetyltransferase